LSQLLAAASSLDRDPSTRKTRPGYICCSGGPGLQNSVWLLEKSILAEETSLAASMLRGHKSLAPNPISLRT
jgi:hypothetical protein